MMCRSAHGRTQCDDPKGSNAMVGAVGTWLGARRGGNI